MRYDKSLSPTQNFYKAIYEPLPETNPIPEVHPSNFPALYALFDALSERQRYSLTRYYGLDGEPRETLREIGEKYGVQRARVGEIINKSIRMLRWPPKIRHLASLYKTPAELLEEISDLERRLEDIQVVLRKKEEECERLTAIINRLNQETLEGQDVESFSELLDEAILEMTIEELDLSVRSFNCLRRFGARTVADLVGMTEEDFAKVRNLGRRDTEEVIAKLAFLGLSIAES